jgi:hypothetical protein
MQSYLTVKADGTVLQTWTFIIIIIIIIGSTALCGPWPSSGASASLLYPSQPFRRRIVRPAFASSDFVTFFFFPGWGCQPHAQPPAILEDQCFLSGLSPLGGWFQFESVRNSLFALA